MLTLCKRWIQEIAVAVLVEIVYHGNQHEGLGDSANGHGGDGGGEEGDGASWQEGGGGGRAQEKQEQEVLQVESALVEERMPKV